MTGENAKFRGRRNSKAPRLRPWKKMTFVLGAVMSASIATSMNSSVAVADSQGGNVGKSSQLKRREKMKNKGVQLAIFWLVFIVSLGMDYLGTVVMQCEGGALGFLRSLLVLFGVMGFSLFGLLALINTIKAVCPEE
ncbi:MAG: hypothetical protein A2Y67_00630 [Candidatus Buchananbacteria bacterium RBG_13_39_9]|uniref:Uncharacterized protein n=1 Tax=Candidatus Buchananbacteria bacterium RBG_13_39_9 TaxID=1797531 RepID=A0A1G1XMD0_9BACT|nr:MAG: hypothetical protein A2Y67_00630 [Candidatus Buchananbacteria bacterium RBG_13_39_9]